MAGARRIKSPYVEYYEPEGNEVIVEIYVPDLIPDNKEKSKKLAKNGEVDVFISNQGFDFVASLKTGKGDKEIIQEWRYKVRRLPSQVIREDCKWSVEKGRVIVSLMKKTFTSWKAAFRERGLDQWSSSEEDETAKKENQKKTGDTSKKKNCSAVDSRPSPSEDQLSTPPSFPVENIATNFNKLELDEKARKRKKNMNSAAELF